MAMRLPVFGGYAEHATASTQRTVEHANGVATCQGGVGLPVRGSLPRDRYRSLCTTVGWPASAVPWQRA